MISAFGPARSNRFGFGVIVMLALSTLMSLSLLFVRRAFFPASFLRFLVWDLFLAWIPCWLAIAIHVLHGRGTRAVALILLGIGWLLFLPNAFYLLTEFVHLQHWHVRLDDEYWFDLMLMVGVAWNGLWLGFTSIFAVQQVVEDRLGSRVGWCLAVAALLLGSFGVSLGRFQRFNSWDVIGKPLSLAEKLLDELFNPGDYPQLYSIAGILFIFLLMGYLTLWAIVLLSDNKNAMMHSGRRLARIR